MHVLECDFVSISSDSSVQRVAIIYAFIVNLLEARS